MKKWFRYLSIRLEAATARWVVPTRIWRLIDRDKLAEAGIELDRASRYWGDHEPELVRARQLIEALK